MKCLPDEALRFYGCEPDPKELFQGRSAVVEVHEDDSAAILAAGKPRRGSIGVDPAVGIDSWVH